MLKVTLTGGQTVVVVEGDNPTVVAQCSRLMQASVPSGFLAAGHPRSRPGEARGIIEDLLKGRQLCTREIIDELLALGHKVPDTTLKSSLRALRRDKVIDRTANSGGVPGGNGRWYLIEEKHLLGSSSEKPARPASGQGTPRRILTLIQANGRAWSAADLAEELKVAVSTVGNALTQLREDGLASAETPAGGGRQLWHATAKGKRHSAPIMSRVNRTSASGNHISL